MITSFTIKEMFLILQLMLVIVLTFDIKCIAGASKFKSLALRSDENQTNTNDFNVVPRPRKIPKSCYNADGVQDENCTPPPAFDWEDIRKKLHASLHYVTRCSRRFYPGVCNEPVNSVFTFSFVYQNCTERLGCRKAVQANRFRSYNRCMHNCKPLIDVYAHILAYQQRTEPKENDHESDDHEEDLEVEGEEEDDDVLRAGYKTRRKGIKALQNLISNIRDEYGDVDEPSLGFPESHEGEPPEDILNSMPEDLDQPPREYMDVSYDFITRDRRTRPRQ